jgi:hypothetical protein
MIRQRGSGKMTISAQRRVGSTPATDIEQIAIMPVESEETRLLKYEVARYTAQMTSELGGMARGANMDLLAYFLDMCRVEANVQMERFEA